MADYAGMQFGNYRLLRYVGGGNFADVYVGEHLHLRTMAAIKVLHTRLAGEQIGYFQEEARTIAHLSHPNIVRVLDFGVEHELPFLVMEYAPLGTLRQRHPGGSKVPLRNVTSYIKQIASALQYAHDQKLIHRDLKPENMLLRKSGEVVLSDFGLALISHSSNSVSRQNLAGTIAYMAPEQIREHPRRASDQYALAAIAYEWLCGELLFDGTFAEVAVKHCLITPPLLHEKAQNLPLAVEQVILKALSKTPEERFHTVQTFADELEQAASRVPFTLLTRQLKRDVPLIMSFTGGMQGSPVQEDIVQAPLTTNTVLTSSNRITDPIQPAVQTTPSIQNVLYETQQMDNSAAKERTQLPSRFLTRRTLLLSSAGALVAAGTGVVLFSFVRSKSSHPVDGAVSLPLVSVPVGHTVYTYQGHLQSVNDLVWSPDGKRIASASDDTTAHVWDAATGQHRLVYSGHTVNRVLSVSWSFDGKYLASSGEDTSVQVWDAKTGHLVYRFTEHLDSVGYVRWSPDSTRIASAGADGVKVWTAFHGKLLLAYADGHDGKTNVYTLTWSPDGTRIVSPLVNDNANAPQDAHNTVDIWNIAQKQRLLTYPGNNHYSILAVGWSPQGRSIATGGDDKTVQLWDAMTAKQTFTYNGHTDSLRGLQWSPDGKYIASAGRDKTVHVWEANTGKTIFVYKNHQATVEAVCWSPDGKYVASASLDKTVKVWRALP